ncbi:MAG: HAMP domain-containing histidine kinase [Anaerolineae bacterium]|nr:HAMP domain-containing histidine kinase [Anaerolineae bacterium]
MEFIKRLFTISAADPDDARRRRLLNVLLLLLSVLSALTLFFALYLNFQGEDPTGVAALLTSTTVMLGGMTVIFLINRFVSGWLASSSFLLLFIGAIFFSVDPGSLLGAFTFYLAIPIIMASALVRPWASFAIAGLVDVLLFSAAVQIQEVAPIPQLLGLLLLAWLSWLSSRNTEQALHEVRVINAELDQRVQDRTYELKQANDGLTVAYEKLKELDRLKSRFVSMVSHELRTPLSAIYGFTEMMEAGIYGPITESQQAALDRIKANDQRLLSLVNDLLDQARMEAGQMSLHIANLSIPELIQDMESTMRVLAEAKGLYLEANIEEGVPEIVKGDSKRLHQIMVNLINNALKFTERGGITVRIYAPDSEHWAMDIIDTGPGIPEDALGYIFEPFRQVDGSAVREHKGFGLGLAIVKQLSELMGGGVHVSSELGKGSTFTVLLPFAVPVQSKEKQK